LLGGDGGGTCGGVHGESFLAAVGISGDESSLRFGEGWR
jgi:hypothetical protein